MKKERKPKSFLQKPHYPGGTKAMREFLSDKLKYPAAARKENIVGTVRIKMTIDYQGHVTNAKVLVGLGYGCDEEAQRVVRLLRFEVPKQRKVRAVFNKTINIHFKTPAQEIKDPPVTAAPQQVAYTITGKVSEKKKADQEDKDQDGSYSYTISF
jgi:protein TonB